MRQCGFDPINFTASLKGVSKYIFDLYRFRLMNKGSSRYKLPIVISPVLKDYRDSAGSATGHYFWQDLVCAKWIYERSPIDHFDVASRIDGFIAHLLTFRAVTILDIRPLQTRILNLNVILGNAQGDLSSLIKTYPSVSSLHSIEHFGLGRYGDAIDPDGHEKGLRNISQCVSLGGHLYVSFPIGAPEVEFNAQRIIDPIWPQKILSDFILEEFVLIPWKGEPIFNLEPSKVDPATWGQAGLYRFKRIS